MYAGPVWRHRRAGTGRHGAGGGVVAQPRRDLLRDGLEGWVGAQVIALADVAAEVEEAVRLAPVGGAVLGVLAPPRVPATGGTLSAPHVQMQS